MKLTKQVRYTIRVRDYEIVQVEVGAELSHYDLGYADQDWATMLDSKRAKLLDQMHASLDIEVDRLAREELEIVASWSEISPNLAEDFLSSAPLHSAPAPVPIRSHHAPTPKTGSTSSRRGVRRSPQGRTPTSTA